MQPATRLARACFWPRKLVHAGTDLPALLLLPPALPRRHRAHGQQAGAQTKRTLDASRLPVVKAAYMWHAARIPV
jgi:hypothetical protein